MHELPLPAINMGFNMLINPICLVLHAYYLRKGKERVVRSEILNPFQIKVLERGLWIISLGAFFTLFLSIVLFAYSTVNAFAIGSYPPGKGVELSVRLINLFNNTTKTTIIFFVIAIIFNLEGLPSLLSKK